VISSSVSFYLGCRSSRGPIGVSAFRVRVRVRERVRESSRLRSGGSLQAYFTPDPPSPCRVRHGSGRVRVRVRSRLRLDRPPVQGLG